MELWIFLYFVVGLFLLAYRLKTDFRQKVVGVPLTYKILVIVFMVSFWWVFVVSAITRKLEERKERKQVK
jgi:amino acid transporter